MPTLLTAATPFYFWGYMKFIGLVVFCLFFSGGGATDRTGHKEVMGGYFEKKNKPCSPPGLGHFV